eukprot:COSAG06_NODE_726_length_12765_cov_10.784147_5_plen_71_part_00
MCCSLLLMSVFCVALLCGPRAILRARADAVHRIRRTHTHSLAALRIQRGQCNGGAAIATAAVPAATDADR